MAPEREAKGAGAAWREEEEGHTPQEGHGVVGWRGRAAGEVEAGWGGGGWWRAGSQE